MYVDTSKNEDTWCEALDDYDQTYGTALRVFKGWWYGWHFARSDGDPNVLNANRNDDGRQLNTYWDKPDNQWNDNGAFAFPVPATLFISPPRFVAGLSFVS